jgi:rhodanese-related sulfurtransferase
MAPRRPLYGDCMNRRSVDDLLRDSRRRLSRVEPEDVARQLAAGAHLIDVRTSDQIARDGQIPRAFEVSLNVLEWRLDPDSASCHPQAPPLDAVVIVICDEGFCSSLAAARLQAIGFDAATDVIGGFQAWRQMEGMSPPASGT